MARLYSFGEADKAGIFKGSSCAFGVFDGFHLGHQSIIKSAIESTKNFGGSSVVLTFDKDPDELFKRSAFKKLASNDMRLSTLLESGVDAVVTLPFTRELAALAPDTFLAQSVKTGTPSCLHVGVDFRFGAQAIGTVTDLERWGGTVGTAIFAHDLAELDGAPITATRIRACLADSDVKSAARLLGRRYSIEAVVEPGRHEGKDMGFATANLAIPHELQALSEGVYAGYATVESQRYKAAISMGVSPTFETATASCEVHILDFDQELYGQSITVEFEKFLRPMIKFDSVDELIATVMGNIQWCRDNL